jgi:hypothetical protein
VSPPPPRLIGVAPGEHVELTLSADFYQYWASDGETGPDFSLGDMLHDGVIAPQRTGLQLASGRQAGPVSVGLHAYGPPPQATADEVAAACDLVLDSGWLEVASFHEKVAYIDWGRPVRVRLHVIMSGRDAASAQPAGPVERHDIYVWETLESQGRWRSRNIDRIGSQLAIETSHVDAGPA